jgi:hypothetical protein
VQISLFKAVAPARATLELFFARPGFCHGLIGDKPKVSVLPIRPRFDVVDDDLNSLQVGRALRRAKQLRVVIQRVEDFDGPDASPGEETRIGGKKILAAFYVKVGAVGAGNGLGHCRDWRKHKCKEGGESGSQLGHLVPPFFELLTYAPSNLKIRWFNGCDVHHKNSLFVSAITFFV